MAQRIFTKWADTDLDQLKQSNDPGALIELAYRTKRKEDRCLLNLGISTVIKDKLCKVPELVIDNKTIQIGDERLVQCVNDALDLQ